MKKGLSLLQTRACHVVLPRCQGGRKHSSQMGKLLPSYSCELWQGSQTSVKSWLPAIPRLPPIFKAFLSQKKKKERERDRPHWYSSILHPLKGIRLSRSIFHALTCAMLFTAIYSLPFASLPLLSSLPLTLFSPRNVHWN